MANTTPLFSFIIPVYNVEKYLNQCVDSILNQEYKNFEVILVDDGSKDNSGKICDEYAEKDKRVRAFHKENGGLSDARNYGLNRAIGEYILFVDSDDFIFENILIEIANVCEKEKADIIFLKGFKYFDENNLIALDQDLNFEGINEKEEILNYLTKLNKFPGSACTKAFKREFLINNELYFLKGLLSEDIEWMIRVLKVINKASYLNKPYYYYRQNREASITNSITSRNINSMVEILKRHSQKEPKTKQEEYINHFLAYEYIILLANYISLGKAERKKVIEDIYEYKLLLKYNNNSKVKIAYLLKKIIGIKMTSKLLYIYLKLR